MLDDEFPLSFFYEQLKKKLADDAGAGMSKPRRARPLRQRQLRGRAPRRPRGHRRGQRRARAGLRRRRLDGRAWTSACARCSATPPGVPRLQRHRRQRHRAGDAAAPVRGGHLPRVGAHQRRRVRGARALRRLQARRRAHSRRQAHARAGARATSSGSATSTTCRPRVVSITQSTELGTVYTPEEIGALPTRRTSTGCCCTSTAPGC